MTYGWVAQQADREPSEPCQTGNEMDGYNEFWKYSRNLELEPDTYNPGSLTGMEAYGVFFSVCLLIYIVVTIGTAISIIF